MTMPSRYQQMKALGLRNLREIHYNLDTARLYEQAVNNGEGVMSRDGALTVRTGKHTGRAPNDRFIVKDATTAGNVDWGPVNKPFDPDAFGWMVQKVEDYLQGKAIYVQDVRAGTDPDHQLNVRVITETAWHSLFTRTVFLPAGNDLQGPRTFVPDFTVIHVPNLQADPQLDRTHSEAFVLLNFDKQLILIGGTHYAGEIKKSIFSVMNYLLPQQGVLPMHCGANTTADGDVTVFFGLSGTGKTTLSADATGVLVGDDEHGWSDSGIFNFEGGCYAKTIRLSPEGEPEIYSAARRFGAILENVMLDGDRCPDFNDDSITENTRCAYPIDFIDNASASGRATHPKHVIFLTADAFGVLPPVSRLTPKQVAYYFLNGYTAKVAGTEAGVREPQATFSACFGAPFMPLDPKIYAAMLRERVDAHGADVWLVNTGWTGGAYGTGHRIPLAYTRAIVNAIRSGQLADVPTREEPFFSLHVPQHVPGVPDDLLDPRATWADPEAYDRQAADLKDRFARNFRRFEVPLQTAV
ncbi:MAG: phosphoenolpyruvate carboxykinase (ATP) [Chloroflexota bacterium]